MMKRQTCLHSHFYAGAVVETKYEKYKKLCLEPSIVVLYKMSTEGKLHFMIEHNMVHYVASVIEHIIIQAFLHRPG